MALVHLHQTEVTRHACSPLLHVSKSYAAAKKRYNAAKWSQRFKNTPGYIVMLNYGQLVEDGLQIAADAMNLSTLTKQEEYFTNHDMQKECRGALQVPQKYEEILLFWKGQKMFFDLRTRMALSPVCLLDDDGKPLGLLCAFMSEQADGSYKWNDHQGGAAQSATNTAPPPPPIASQPSDAANAGQDDPWGRYHASGATIAVQPHPQATPLPAAAANAVQPHPPPTPPPSHATQGVQHPVVNTGSPVASPPPKAPPALLLSPPPAKAPPYGVYGSQPSAHGLLPRQPDWVAEVIRQAFLSQFGN